MFPTTTYPYTFQRYQGRATRYTCPACQKPHCFTRYLDTATGELLDDTYGRCDHELNCGYHRSPYQDKLPKRLAAAPHYGQADTRLATGANHSLQFALPAVHTIPTAILEASVQPGHYRANALAILLRKHFGLGDADELLRRFQLGTSAYWPGGCVFWLIDEQGRVRGGQVVLYDETGHTVKINGYRHTCWMHTALTRRYQRLGMPVPTWLINYNNTDGQKSPCLFGLPQLTTAPVGQPIAIVESAKTAIIATYYMPEFLWLATMGLGNLTEARLCPLKGRQIRLFPDAGAFEKWNQRAADLHRLGYQMEVSDLLEKVVTPAGRQAGLDLADVLLHEHPGYPPSWNLKL